MQATDTSDFVFLHCPLDVVRNCFSQRCDLSGPEEQWGSKHRVPGKPSSRKSSPTSPVHWHWTPWSPS